MLAAGASVEGPAVPTYENGRPLMAAVTSGNIKMIKCLISNGVNVDAPSPLKLSDPEGRIFLCRGVRAVHVAVVNAMPQQLQVLLDAGANPDVAHSEGITPLMATCQMMRPAERIEMARQLLEAGADPTRGRSRRLASAFLRVVPRRAGAHGHAAVHSAGNSQPCC